MKEKSFVVSVIIVNWNAKDLLRNCIISIKQQTRCSFEIIVIDNASSDGSAAMVQSEFSDVVLIANHDNRGFAAANNQGILIAKGQYVLLLNPDTIILDGAIDTMIEWSDRREDVGCAGCSGAGRCRYHSKNLLCRPNAAEAAACRDGFAPNAFGYLAILLILSTAGGTGRSARDVDVVSGMFMLIRRSVLDHVGLLDEAFFIYAEEADLCRRIRNAGLRCSFTPVARILHLDGGGKSTDQVKPRMHIQLQKSLLLYIRKHHGFAGMVVTKAMYVTIASLRMGCLLMRSNAQP